MDLQKKPQTRFLAVIFDLDGLILDTEIVSKRAWKIAASDAGFTLSDKIYEKVIGISAKDTMATLSEVFGDDFPAVEVYASRLRYFNEIIDQEGIHIKPGFLELNAYLDEKNILKAIATSSGHTHALQKIKKAGLQDHFSFISTGDQVSKGKPAPDIFLNASKKLDVKPRFCIALEDSDDGAMAVHSAGMSVVVVPDLKPPSDETAGIAMAVYNTIEESIPLIQNLLEKGL